MCSWSCAPVTLRVLWAPVTTFQALSFSTATQGPPRSSTAEAPLQKTVRTEQAHLSHASRPKTTAWALQSLATCLKKGWESLQGKRCLSASHGPSQTVK